MQVDGLITITFLSKRRCKSARKIKPFATSCAILADDAYEAGPASVWQWGLRTRADETPLPQSLRALRADRIGRHLRRYRSSRLGCLLTRPVPPKPLHPFVPQRKPRDRSGRHNCLAACGVYPPLSLPQARANQSPLPPRLGGRYLTKQPARRLCQCGSSPAFGFSRSLFPILLRSTIRTHFALRLRAPGTVQAKGHEGAWRSAISPSESPIA